MKRAKSKRVPFFARYLVKQQDLKSIGGQSVFYTLKYPSDDDEYVTMKYPSDDDELTA